MAFTVFRIQRHVEINSPNPETFQTEKRVYGGFEKERDAAGMRGAFYR